MNLKRIEYMRTNNVILIALIAVILVGLIYVGASTFMSTANNTTNNITNNTTVNATVNDTNNTTTEQTKTQTTSKKSSKSSSDDIPTEGKYKGVEYSLHQGGYPYYSAQNDKVYKNKREEYNDMKRAIDSGIAD